MANYLFIIKGGKGINLKELNTEARRLFFKSWHEWLKYLKKKDFLIYGSPVFSDGIVIHNSGKLEAVPENYDMASDIITGFCVIKTDNEANAREIAKSCSLLDDEFTSCEIRQLKSTD